MEGNFESGGYFTGIDLKRYYVLKEDLITKESRKFVNENYKGFDAICVSVRRGDFVNNSLLDVCDSSYFENAIEFMGNKLKKPLFIFFSDDINWTKENIRCNFNKLYEKPGNDIANKIFIMSKCNHYILSNSTFSWWVWYLSDKAVDQIVISPKSGHKNEEYTVLISPDWILF